MASSNHADLQATNFLRRLSSLKVDLTDYVKRLSKFQRTPATHVFVVMVSSELRNRKPYALPVQCLPYCGMNEKDIRRIISNLIREMVKLGMSVRGKYNVIVHCVDCHNFTLFSFVAHSMIVGFVSNGLFTNKRKLKATLCSSNTIRSTKEVLSNGSKDTCFDVDSTS